MGWRIAARLHNAIRLTYNISFPYSALTASRIQPSYLRKQRDGREPPRCLMEAGFKIQKRVEIFCYVRKNY